VTCNTDKLGRAIFGSATRSAYQYYKSPLPAKEKRRAEDG
jgi:hypothetical protein